MVTVASRFLRYIPEEPMRGPDVLEVQRRLRALGFYQGTLDSIYGRGTFDAVVAFQARRQLSPDGIVGPSTYAALGQGALPPALGDRGPSITIDLERRRLYFNRRNVPQRMYEVAVGAPASPTPVGRWVVVEKALNPGGPFGTRWIRINIPWGGYPIHSKTTPGPNPTVAWVAAFQAQSAPARKSYASAEQILATGSDDWVVLARVVRAAEGITGDERGAGSPPFVLCFSRLVLPLRPYPPTVVYGWFLHAAILENLVAVIFEADVWLLLSCETGFGRSDQVLEPDQDSQKSQRPGRVG